jgi:hypothetical protein
MPPLVQEISELFECVIGCGHVSVAPSHTYFVCAAGNGQAIAKKSAERGPLVAAIDTFAGRYGDARTRGRSPNRAHRLLHKDCFVWSGSFRSFSLTVHRSPHTLTSWDALHSALRSCHRCCGGGGSHLVSSPWPKDHLPFYSLMQWRRACGVCAPACLSTSCCAAFQIAQQLEERPFTAWQCMFTCM